MNRLKISCLMLLLLAAMLLPGCFHNARLGTAPPLPVAQADAGGFTYKGEAWLFGGLGTNDKDILTCTQIFNPAAGWRLGPVMPTPRWGSCVAELDGIAYIFGGADVNGTYLTTCEALDLNAGTWSTRTSMPYAFRGSTAVAVPEMHRIFLFFDNLVYSFNPASNDGMGSYTRMANAPISRRWTTCGLVNIGGELRIYHIGGIFVASEPHKDLRDNYYYRPLQNDWSGPQAEAPYAADGQTGREGPVYDGTKLIYGFGEVEARQFFNKLYTYDAAADKFSELLATGTPRDGVNSSIINGILYVIGGRNTNPYAGGLATNESFNLNHPPPSS